MNFIKFNTYFTENLDYNYIIEPLLIEYFSPAEVGPEGYLPIGKYNENLARRYSSQSEIQKEVLLDKEVKYGDENLPVQLEGYEKSIAARLLYGNMINYIISGPMGSGKSSTMDYIINSIKETDAGKRSIFIKLDFNENYDTNNVDELMQLFLDDLYNKLKVKIIKKLSNYRLADRFLSFTETDEKFSQFYNLYFEKIYKKNPEWEKNDEREKIYTIFKFIETKVKRLERQVDLVMRFLNYLGKYIEKRDGIVLIFYDNIDKLPSVAQINILNKIFSYNKIAEVKKVIATRRSTKAKLDKNLTRKPSFLAGTRAQIVYGHIYHHGPSPRDIYIRKLSYLVKNIHKIKLFGDIKEEYKRCIIKRSNELIRELFNKHSNFSQAIYCVAGESKRLGLTLVQRNFCNHVYRYNETAPNSNQICRTLYVGNDKFNMMSYDDPYVANIFSNKKMEFSLINYLVFSLIKEEEGNKTASYYYNFLYDNFEFRDGEIIDALNYLLSDKRALIRGEFFPGYRNSDELMKIDDVLRTTELGDRYFEKLYKEGAIYTQNCLFSLKWELGSDKDRKESILNRAKLIRNILKEAREIESIRIEYYAYNINSFEIKDYALKSVVCHLTYLHYKRFFSIFHSFERPNPAAFEELDQWLEMVEFWNYDSTSIGGYHAREFIELLDRMKSLNQDY